MSIDTHFEHLQTAHCENGATTALLRYNGLPFLTEPLSFGIGSGLFYIHIPFLKINKGPAISFRIMPGSIFKRTNKALGIKIKSIHFASHSKAASFLDKKLEEGVPVGCQVGVYHLPYFPKEYRFHFNAHNIIIFGKNDTHYFISDPVMEHTTLLTPEELEKVRFAKGLFSPKGRIYFPEYVPKVNQQILKKAIIKGIKRNVRDMLYIPGHIAGVKGIVYTSKKIRKLNDKMGIQNAGFYLAQIVRMQEEIGTGGGGFRYVYAAFLEQAATIFQNEHLMGASNEFTKAGNMWRDNAVQMAGIYKGRLQEQKDFDDIAENMLQISEVEKMAFKNLSKIKLSNK